MIAHHMIGKAGGNADRVPDSAAIGCEGMTSPPARCH